MDDLLIDNFFGFDYFNQLRILDEIVNTLEAKKAKDVKREFLKNFRDYINMKVEMYEAFDSFYYIADSSKKEICLSARHAVEVLDTEESYLIREDFNRGKNYDFGCAMLLDAEERNKFVDVFLRKFSRKNMDQKLQFIRSFCNKYKGFYDYYRMFFPDEALVFDDADELMSFAFLHFDGLSNKYYEIYKNASPGFKFDVIKYVVDTVNVELDKKESEKNFAKENSEVIRQKRYYNRPSNLRK